jgi:amino acid adenylation domain-containing protein
MDRSGSPPARPPRSTGPASPLSPAAQALLAERLKRRAAGPVSRQDIPRRSGTGPAPLSFAQERLWFLAQLHPENPAYNMVRAFALRGPLDRPILERSLREIVRRHEILRTTFAATRSSPVQRIAPGPALLLPTADLAALPTGVREAEAKRLRRAEAHRPFDLERDPPLRLVLLHLGSEEHVLLLTLHHIAADGWSMDVLFRELSALYAAFSRDRPSPLAELPVQYADFAVWQRDRLQGETLERLLVYWRRQLGGAPPVLELPYDRLRPPVRTWAGDWRIFELHISAAALQQAGAARGTSPFMVLLAAFFALLHRTTGCADLAVGCPAAGRDRKELEGSIGLFVNTLVLRADLAGNPSFDEILRRTRETSLGAYDHQEMPFDKLVEVLAPERDLGYTPLFQVLFALETMGGSGPELPGVAVHSLEEWSGTSKFDLSFTLRETGEGFAASLDYDREIFDGPTAARFAAHYEALLAGAAADPGKRLSDLPLLAAAERQQLLREWNGAGSGSSGEPPVHELFALQARSRPGAPAVTTAGVAGESLTYAELNARANRLAHHLRALGVGPETPVGVCLNRSVEAVMALLAILKAGGAYVPLDPAYPRERLAFMLEDTAAPVILTLSSHLPSLPGLEGRQVVVLDHERERIAARSASDPESGAGADHLAYIIYTSGSTGRPKGVAVPHRAVTRLVRGTRFAALTAGETWLCFAPIAFDASTLEIWGCLANGGRLVVFPSYTPSLQELGQAIEGEGVTSLWLTSGLFHQMVDGALDSLRGVRQLLAGGDVLSAPHVERVLARFPDLTLINGYGPTENTTFTCCHRLRGPQRLAGSVPIGRPVDGTRGLLLDPRLQPAPIGSAGELSAGGEGLARGYLNRPELTAERFVPDPASQEPGARLYRTGDLARHLPDGSIEFLGRIDHQVKIRGFRIEPGEVEAALCAHPRVQEAVVLAREDAPGEKRLVAYVVAEEGALPPDLRSFLRERLPEPMLPAAFVWMEALPLDPNGKVDRKALPAPGVDGPERDPRVRRAPRNPVEELLAGIWAEVMRIEPPGVDENFFDLGGHSLLATWVVSRVREVCAVDLPLVALFEGPTVAELAGQVEAARRGGKAPPPPILPLAGRTEALLSFAQERLWFLARLEPESPFYNIPAALRLAGRLDVPALARSLAEVQRRHSVLRAVFTTSPTGLVQSFAPLPPAALPAVDLSALDPGVRRAEASRLATEEARRPFDLTSGRPMRAALLQLSASEHLLLLTLHHIVADGWSMGIFARELSALYGVFLGGGPSPAAADRRSPLAEPTIQYADFAHWQREWLRGEVLEEQLAFWRQRLAGAPALLELPTDRPRPPVMRFRGSRVAVALGPEITGALAALGRRCGATLFMTLTAGFTAVLSRSSGLYDIPMGTIAAGRDQQACEDLIGLFVKTLILRADLAGDPGFGELLGRVRRVAIEAFAHQDVPFEKLVQELRPERSLAHSPLFQVMLMLADPLPPFELPGLTIALEHAESGTVKFDLNFALIHDNGRVTGSLGYHSDIFDAVTVARLVDHFGTLLQGAAEDPGRRLSELPLLKPAERHQALHEWNDTWESLPDGLCLHELFLAQAERTPEAPALFFAGQTLTYGQLAERTGRLARRLRSLGVRPGVLVAVHLERGPEMVVALLGILQAGGAYVPLSTSFPEERLRLILSSLEIAHLLTEDPPPGGAASLAVAHTVFLPLRDEGAEEGPEAPPASAGPEDLAYIIFTSGSTGMPKGVMVRHRPAVNIISWVNRTFGIGPSDRVLFVTALSFDLSVYDVFGLLAAGGSLRIASAEEVRDPRRLTRILEEEPVTFWDSAPAALQQLAPFLSAAPRASARLRLVFLSGDWIPVGLPDRVRQAFPRAQVVSLGGATEATIWSNHYLVREVPPGWRSIPYGRPTTHARYHVLDPDSNLYPIGVPGDLYIGGECLSTGYAGDPVLTAQKYLPTPFGEERGARLYRTGDRARHWADGTLEFLGRTDTQVKIRGFRIELGEIETALGGHPGVREAVVLVREDTRGDKRLVACVIPAGEPAPALAELRRFLKTRLPEYMLPSELALRDAWPVTATGKLDRRALLENAAERPARRTALGGTTPAGAPRGTALERTIAAIWAEVIGLDEVSVRENFFDLGGHSLLMIEVQARLGEALGREVAMVDLFQYPTIAALAEHLEGTRPAPHAAAPFRGPAAGSAVAIIGMAGRFPGAWDVEELWRNLCGGVESITFFTDEELAAAGIDPVLLADPAYVPARGVLPGADLFDAAFFDCTPREAEILDPQQRVILECAWEALEAAGYVPERCPGRVGVYAGLGDNTYAPGLYADPGLVRSVGLSQLAIANKADYLPTRVSYKLNLQGPSVNVQTACSTSLTAVHLACRALLAGECEMALAGGVSIRCPQVAGYRWEEGSIASRDGHVRAFDAAACGTVGGNGAGIVVLKRLDDALADGDTVRAVILGSAINNDGSSKVGFTAPSVDGQAKVILQAHRAAGIDPESIRYVEAHGTGTAVGDPIEVAALTQAFRAATPKRGFCALGTVKTNLGHLDAAAGIAGLIKTALCLERRSLPPSLHFAAPNPRIDFDDSPFFVNAALAGWPAEGAPRRAGVSAFGIGGTNAHAVLEEAPTPEPGGTSRPAQLLLLSARTAAALEAATARFADHLEDHPEIDLADAAHTLQTGRRVFRHRRMLVCGNREEAVRQLRDLDPIRVFTREHASGPGAVAFLFPGQGAQRAGMGAQLYAAEPAFRQALDRACEILLPELGLDLRELLGPATAGAAEAERRLADTALAQPALFAVEHALARLLMEWGIRPQAMLGHSLGEYVAACLAGVFTLEEGLRLVAARGRLMGELPPGRMLAVDLPEEEARALLGELPQLALAAVNAPAACALSGPPEAVERLREHLVAQGVSHRRLRTSHAFHSPMMEPILERFADEVRRINFQPPEIPYLSNVTGTWITAAEATDPDYWVQHLRRTVRFSDGAAALSAGTDRILLEVGPGRTLTTLARQQPGGRQRPIVAALGGTKHESAEPALLLSALGRLWLAGAEVDWSGFYARERRRRVPLPTYPFERRRYWLDARAVRTAAAPAAEPARTPAAAPPGGGGTAFRNGIEQQVAAVFEELLGVPGVRPGHDFFDLGGSSLMAVQLGARLRQTLGAELPASALLEDSTVAALAARIAASLPGDSRPQEPPRPTCLVRLRTGGGKRPLFLVHQVGGHVYSFRALARALSPDRPIYGLRSRGLELDEEPLTAVGEMADLYIDLVREAQPRGPYLLGGASMGGLVALEMAHRLRAAGEDVPLLTLIDTPCREVLSGPPADEVLLAQVLPAPRLTAEEVRGLAPEEQLARAIEKAHANGGLPAGFDAVEAGRLLRVLRANVAALFAYELRACDAPVLFFRARERRDGDAQRPEQPWIDLAGGGIEIHVVPGNHATMHDPPHVQAIAERLARRLDALGN